MPWRCCDRVSDMNNEAATHQAMALAGVFQAGLLADSIAARGQHDPDALSALMQAVMNLEPENYEAVFPSLSSIKPGLEMLVQALEGGRERESVRPTSYALALLHLGNQLRRDTAMANILRNRLEALQAQRAHFGELHDAEFCHRLAGIYVDTLGTLKFRIKVQGEPAHLRNEDNAARIRALFLAGVRCAILWQQAGGRRWKLLFNRNQVLKAARALQTNL